jgi:inositol transport system substrate-binding protein
MKKAKSMALIIFSILLTVALAACGSKSGTTSSTSAAPSAAGNTSVATNAASSKPAGDKKIKIGVTYQNLQNEFIINIQDKLKAKAKEMGVELIEADGQGKAENQIAQVENFITQKVDAIILNPFDKDGDAPAVDKAVAAKIPIIVVNAQVSNLDKATAFVGSDDVEAGKIEMQYMADQLGGKGNIVIIHGANGHSAEVGRTKGNKEILAKYPDIKVLAEQTGNWDRAQSLTLMENWLQKYPNLNGVVGQNDEEGLGAYKAIEAAGKQKDIKVVGIDAIPDALKAVDEGKFAATVFQDAGGQGAGAVEIAVKAVKGEKFEKNTYIPFQLVTKENLAKFKK